MLNAVEPAKTFATLYGLHVFSQFPQAEFVLLVCCTVVQEHIHLCAMPINWPGLPEWHNFLTTYIWHKNK